MIVYRNKLLQPILLRQSFYCFVLFGGCKRYTKTDCEYIQPFDIVVQSQKIKYNQCSFMSNKHSGIRYQLIFSILLLIYTAVLVYFAYPFAIENLEDLKAREHFEMYIAEKSSIDFSSFQIFLYSNEGIVSKNREIEIQNRDMLHLSLEALLTGSDEEDLENGIISYIPKNTELVGVSVANGTIFAEFTDKLLDSRNPELAYIQIEETIKASYQCKEIYIIVDGAIINR